MRLIYHHGNLFVETFRNIQKLHNFIGAYSNETVQNLQSELEISSSSNEISFEVDFSEENDAPSECHETFDEKDIGETNQKYYTTNVTLPNKIEDCKDEKLKHLNTIYHQILQRIEQKEAEHVWERHHSRNNESFNNPAPSSVPSHSTVTSRNESVDLGQGPASRETNSRVVSRGVSRNASQILKLTKDELRKSAGSSLHLFAALKGAASNSSIRRRQSSTSKEQEIQILLRNFVSEYREHAGFSKTDILMPTPSMQNALGEYLRAEMDKPTAMELKSARDALGEAVRQSNPSPPLPAPRSRRPTIEQLDSDFLRRHRFGLGGMTATKQDVRGYMAAARAEMARHQPPALAV